MPRSQDDFEREIRAHLALEADQLRAEGLPPDQARTTARRKFGNVTSAQERFYFANRHEWIDGIKSDLVFALRMVRRAPWMTLVAVMVLAIGLGATLTIYAGIVGVVLRPLPFSQPDKLVQLSVASATQSSVRAGASAPDFNDWKEMTHAFTELGAFRQWGFELATTSEPERVVGVRVTANLFSLLGVRPLLGRVFGAGEDAPAANAVVVLSDSLWRRVYAGNRAAVGKTIELNGSPFTIVGVVASDAMHPSAALWIPYVFAPYELTQRGDRALSVVARLRPGVTVEQALADFTGAVRELGHRYPDADAGWEGRVLPLRDALIGNSRQTLGLLLVATCGLLLVACANLANGMIARILVRRRELAVRTAIGASRARLIQQLSTECVVLVGFGAAAGLGLAVGGTHWLAQLGPRFLPRSSAIHLDFHVFLAAAVFIGLVVATLSTLIGLAAIRIDLAVALKAHDVPARSRRFTGRDAFVIGQIALALVLVVDGALLVTSFRRVQAVPLGFTANDIVTATVSLPSGRYGSAAQRTAFFDDVLRSLRAQPNVADAAIANRVPFASSASAGVMNTIQVVGDAAPLSRAPRAGVMTVSPGYFDLLRIRTMEGRLFSAQDRGGQTGVVIIDETVARALAPSRSVIGTRIQLGGATGADTTTREIVGVVAAVRMGDVTRPAEPLLYLPYAQSPWPTMNIMARGGTDYGALRQSVRQTIASVDATRPVYNVRKLQSGVDDAVASRRLETVLLSGFAVSASLLAFLGVYSILSFSVKTREREFGIRLAVGANAHQVLREIVLESLKRVGSGVALGLALTWVAGATIRAALFDVSPLHLPTVFGAVMALGLGALAASYFPARRAAMMDPAGTLRAD